MKPRVPALVSALVAAIALGALALLWVRLGQVERDRERLRGALERLEREEAGGPDRREDARALERLREENAALRGELGALRAERDAAWQALRRDPEAGPEGPSAPRDLADLRDEIFAARADLDGEKLLALTAELYARGEAALPELLELWTLLAEAPPPGVGRIDLQLALLRQPELLLLALGDPELTRPLRRLAARALASSGGASQRELLARIDLSNEPDRSVLHALVPLLAEQRSPDALPQLLPLLARQDLTNNFRQSIALAIADIDGSEADAAFRTAVEGTEDPAIQYVLPALRTLRDPPVESGLVVIDGPREASSGGVLLGDVILAYDGEPIRSISELWAHAERTAPGEWIPLRVWRDRSEVTIEIPGGTGSYDFRIATSSRPIRAKE